jgi:hypothetical protein
METNSDSDEDDQHFSKLQRSATRNGFTARFRVALGLSLILVIIGLGLVGLSASSLVTNLGCSALALNSTCQPPSHATVVSSPKVTARLTVAPTATPTLMPSPTPTPGVAPSQAPTPTPFPELTDQQVVTNTIQRYENLVVVDGAYRKAYNLLSTDLQARETYDDFIQNPNYTLKKGCWITGTMHVSQRNSLTWDGGVELTQVSCVDTTPIAHYDWHFEVQKQNGLFVITSIGLYPTGSQNQ